MHSLFNVPIKIIKRLATATMTLGRFVLRLPSLYDAILFQQTKSLQENHPNPLNSYGRKCFSQSDEDGITLEILSRLDALDDGVFVEFGVGDGTENNTLILAALGWRGFWVGGQDLAIDLSRTSQDRFTFLQDWITLDNIVQHLKAGLTGINSQTVDVISMDLDGNDLYFINALLGHGYRPKLFIVEYNAKFPPPVRFSIEYDPQHTWNGTDYFGASLASFAELFAQHDYKLVCCNSQTGANAFFVDSAFADRFTDVPDDIDQIYVEPRYHLYLKYGHRKSTRVIEQVLGKNPGSASI